MNNTIYLLLVVAVLNLVVVLTVLNHYHLYDYLYYDLKLPIRFLRNRSFILLPAHISV